jgi:hypothetical protein
MNRSSHPRFQDAHNTHPPDKRQRQSDDFTTVCASLPFHCPESPWDNGAPWRPARTAAPPEPDQRP